MTTGILKYNCLKCGKPIQLVLSPIIQPRTLEVFGDMFDAKLCLDCHCNKRVPELVECLMN
jgi:hypothetical protein